MMKGSWSTVWLALHILLLRRGQPLHFEPHHITRVKCSCQPGPHVDWVLWGDQLQFEVSTQWTTYVSSPSILRCYVTKCAPHEAPNSIAWRQVDSWRKGRCPPCGRCRGHQVPAPPHRSAIAFRASTFHLSQMLLPSRAVSQLGSICTGNFGQAPHGGLIIFRSPQF